MSIFSDLKKATPEYPAGYRGFDGYPSAYQAADFPQHGYYIRITGNNQAFFFVSAVKSEGRVVDVELNTTALRKLFGNIIAQADQPYDRPAFWLQIDADLFENPARFVEKYHSLRSEPEPEARRLLAKEAELIRTFVNNGQGFVDLAKSVFAEANTKAGRGAELSDEVLQDLAHEFLENNFRLVGIRTDQALKFATWKIASYSEGNFLARQEYRNSTHMVARPWQVGVEPELSSLAAQGHEGAKQILNAVEYTDDPEKAVNLTYGSALKRPLAAMERLSGNNPAGPSG